MKIEVRYRCSHCDQSVTETIDLRRGQSIRRDCQWCGNRNIFLIQGKRRQP